MFIIFDALSGIGKISIKTLKAKTNITLSQIDGIIIGASFVNSSGYSQAAYLIYGEVRGLKIFICAIGEYQKLTILDSALDIYVYYI